MAVISPTKPRLRKVDCTGPGLRRVRRGRGFSILDPDGERVEEPEVLTRISELVIPPAWNDVWICPYPGGHIQATGVDQKGRKYIDPRTFDRHVDGITIAGALPELAVEGDGTAIQGDVEAAVLELLTGEESPALAPPGGELAAEAA
jgi:hypothetical protein